MMITLFPGNFDYWRRWVTPEYTRSVESCSRESCRVIASPVHPLDESFLTNEIVHLTNSSHYYPHSDMRREKKKTRIPNLRRSVK